jgi:CspA family cold shock protein
MGRGSHGAASGGAPFTGPKIVPRAACGDRWVAAELTSSDDQPEPHDPGTAPPARYVPCSNLTGCVTDRCKLGRHERESKEERRRALEAMMTGKIRTLRVDKGFGFIKDDGGKEYFFHQSAVYGEGLEDLREGDSVEFDVGQGPKGPRAENVRRTST